MQPRLTVGVPHLDRSEFLGEAIDCLLEQTVPCKILVADQGGTPETAELLDKYRDNPLVIHVRTNATCLWENWKTIAETAMNDGASFFAWTQDDDIVHPRYAERIELAFDSFADAKTWTARLAIAEHKHLAIWYGGGPGPKVPMDLLRNRPLSIPGELMTPVAYFESWALSPAVAFRCGQDFRDALNEVPTRCDLYTERTILAAMGAKGKVVCDPSCIGYWRHHGKNESYRQNLVEKPEQEARFLEWIDAKMDATADWLRHLVEWARVMPNGFLASYQAMMDGMDSRYAFAVADALKRCMREEVRYEDLRRELDAAPAEAELVMV